MRPTRPAPILRHTKQDPLLVTNLVSIRYLSGLEVSAGAMLIRPRAMRLYVDDRYKEEALERCTPNVSVQSLDFLGKDLSTLKRCAFEAEQVSVARLAEWKRKFKNTKFIQSTGVIEEFRRSKSEDELRLFRKAQFITRQILRQAETALQPGMSERELAWKLRQWAVERGAEDLSFEPIVAFGSHSSRPHHHVTDRILRKRDIVQIDVGAKYGGYCADQSRVFFRGEPTAEQKNVFAAVKQAKRAATHAITVGVTIHTLDKLARDILRKKGLEEFFTHSLGHGVGLEIHEGISLSSKGKQLKLLKGEIVTIEPGVYLPGKFGIRLEDEVVVGMD